MSAPPAATPQLRRNLKHFAVGKLVSSLIGVALLLLVVRALPREAYGAYIALLALFELLQLGSNLGVFSAAFRYVPELQSKGLAHELARVLAGLVAYRLLTLLLAAGLLVAFAQPVADWSGLATFAPALQLYALVVLFEGLGRFLDVVFDSMMLQAYAQISSVLRTGLRLVALLWLSHAGAGVLDLQQWVLAEALASAIGCLVGLVLLWRRARPADGVPRQAAVVSAGRMLRFAAPTYLAQIVGMASGADAIKLVVSKLSGVLAAAAFGFAAALSATIQRYMPAFLLIGMVRPLFVSSREQGRSADDLVRFSGTLFKLNLLALFPVVAALIVAGPVLMDLLSGGKLPDSLPYVHFFMALLVLQILHAVIGLIGIAYEEGRGNLWGTVFGVGGPLVALLGHAWLGTAALCAGLLVSEIAWCATMVWALRAHGVHYRLPLRGLGKLTACLVLASGSACFLLHFSGLQGQTLVALAAAALAGLGFLALAAWFKPFESNERELINRLLPARMFIW